MNGGSFFVNIGVGQGTILGPTLLKIYIMDLHLHTSLFCVKFADKSIFDGSGRIRDEVEELVNAELIKISDWFKNNRLTLHPNNSRYIIDSRDKLISIKLNDTADMRCGFGLRKRVSNCKVYTSTNILIGLFTYEVCIKISLVET